MTDITTRKTQNLSAAAAGDAQTDICANMLSELCHSLRSPLGGVRGMLELLLRNTDDEKNARYLTLALDSCREILALVTDVQDINTMRGQSLSLRREPFDLIDLIGEVLDRFGTGNGGDRITARQGAVPRNRIVGDRQRLSEVLETVLKGALERLAPERVHMEYALDPLPREAGRDGDSALLRVGLTFREGGSIQELDPDVADPVKVLSAEISRNRKPDFGLIKARMLARLLEGDLVARRESDMTRITLTMKLDTMEAAHGSA
jgi:hypothetical protein